MKINGIRSRCTMWLSVVFSAALVSAILSRPVNAVPRSGELELHVVDDKTGKPLACRMHLKNVRGRPRKAPKMPFLEDHFTFQSPG